MQQRAAGSERGLTGLSLRRISLLVPYHQRRARQKRGPWFESLLGNWGSYVWNVSPYACDIPPCESSGHRSHNLSLFTTPQLCISFLIKKKKKKRCGALGREQQTHILSVPVKLLSNCCRAAGGADICFSLAAGCRPCRSQSPGMPHTFCLFYMSKQIVNWLIIFVLTMSFTAVSLLSALFALFKYEPSGPPLHRSLLH